MGSLKSFGQYIIFEETGVSSSFITDVEALHTINGYSAQIIFTNSSSMSGTLTLEASLVEDGTFTTVTGSSQNISGNGSHMYDVTIFQYPYVRIVFTSTSGSADFQIYFCKRGEK